MVDSDSGPIGLTLRQSQLLNFLRQFYLENDHMPNLRQMCAFLKCASKSSPFMLLRQLEARGHVRRGGTRSYSAIELVSGPWAISPDMLKAINRHCKKHGTTPGQVVGRALEAYFT